MHRRIRSILRGAVVVIVIQALMCGADPRLKTVGPARPDLPEGLSFLLITVDTLRPDLGYMGYGRPVSPNIDRLAARSIVYENAYAIGEQDDLAASQPETLARMRQAYESFMAGIVEVAPVPAAAAP